LTSSIASVTNVGSSSDDVPVAQFAKLLAGTEADFFNHGKLTSIRDIGFRFVYILPRPSVHTSLEDKTFLKGGVVMGILNGYKDITSICKRGKRGIMESG
jgi:hypothetical protein